MGVELLFDDERYPIVSQTRQTFVIKSTLPFPAPRPVFSMTAIFPKAKNSKVFLPMAGLLA